MTSPMREGRVVHPLGPLPFDAYVGRAAPRHGLEESLFANPYKIGEHGDRAEVLRKYEEWLDYRLERPISRVDMSRGVLREAPGLGERELLKLKGKVLACWCAEKGQHLTAEDDLVCHAQIMLRRIAKLSETPGLKRVEDLEVAAYDLPNEGRIEKRSGGAWAVVEGGRLVLNRMGEWEREPSPSNRDEAFLARTRYRTAQEALDRWNQTEGPNAENER